MARVFPRWTRSRRCFRCRILATASGSMRCMTQRTDEIAEIGKQYGTKPGFYLIVGPHWKGEAPAGINAVVRSSTDLVFAIPRVFKDDTAEDRQGRPAAAQPGRVLSPQQV